MSRLCGISFSFILFFASYGIPTLLASDQSGLKDLKQFRVEVNLNCGNPSFEKRGLSSDELKTKIEVRLRQADIAVSDYGSLLLLNLTAVMIEDINLYAYTMELEVSDLVIKNSSLPRILLRIFADYRSSYSDSLASGLASRIMDIKTMDDYIKALNEIFGGNQKIGNADTSLTCSELEELFRNESIYANVWSKLWTATSGVSGIGESEKRILESLVDEFINEYLKANPRGKTR